VFLPALPGELAGAVPSRDLKDEAETIDNVARFEVLTAVLMKIHIFRVMTPY
jgi:hypothetical protein